MLFPWISVQNPRTPKVIEPETPVSASDALRKYTDLKYGTEKTTTARRAAAVKVTKNPGVAGRMMPMLLDQLLVVVHDPGKKRRVGYETRRKMGVGSKGELSHPELDMISETKSAAGSRGRHGRVQAP